SPAAAYLRVPFRCSIEKLTAVANGSITPADCALALALHRAAHSGSPLPPPAAGARAGPGAPVTPAAQNLTTRHDPTARTPTPPASRARTCAGNCAAVLKQA